MKRRYLLILAVFFICSVWVCAAKKAKLPIENEGVKIVPYETYGDFLNIGTEDFEYKIKDKKKLAAAVGDGIYPNVKMKGKMLDRYKKLYVEGKIRKNQIWSHVNSGDPEADFLAWVTIRSIGGNRPEDSEGIKQFFIAEILKEAGYYEMAIKAYYAVLISFPKTACWSADGSFVWYVASAALDKINILLREHPGLGIQLKGAYIEIENGDDTDLDNDIVVVNPGIFVKNYVVKERVDLKDSDIIHTRGSGKVKLVQYSNSHWRLMVDGAPYVIRGITYAPTMVGTPATEPGRSTKWMHLDTNNNKKCDAAYDSWVDKNKNAKQDANELSVGDFKLMKDMGINTIRMYHLLSKSEYLPEEFDKKILRDLFKTYGIRIIMGDFFGAYCIGSGASGCTDYRDPKQRQLMKESVRKMVLDHKDEPYVLMWLLGNENDMAETFDGINATKTNASECPKEYAEFLNEVIDMIHEIDPDHPVAISNFGTTLVKYYADYTPSADIFGVNLYMGKDGFGHIWKQISMNLDIPVLITEYGCDAYFEGQGIDEDKQVGYHEGNWKDIKYNLAGGQGQGNALGGVVFEWLDEWWKSGSPSTHEAIANAALPFPDGWSHEEWFGVCGQGDGFDSPFLRHLRKVYFFYKDNLWKKEVAAE